MVKRQYQNLLADSFKFAEIGQEVEGIIKQIGTKDICGEGVPYIHLCTPDGEMIEILMGSYALMKLWSNEQFNIHGYLALRYDGESKSIISRGNAAKLYSFVYWAPGSWELDPEGGVIGEPTPLDSRMDDRKQMQQNPANDLPFTDASSTGQDVPIDFSKSAEEDPAGSPQISRKKSKK